MVYHFSHLTLLQYKPPSLARNLSTTAWWMMPCLPHSNADVLYEHKKEKKEANATIISCIIHILKTAQFWWELAFLRAYIVANFCFLILVSPATTISRRCVTYHRYIRRGGCWNGCRELDELLKPQRQYDMNNVLKCREVKTGFWCNSIVEGWDSTQQHQGPVINEWERPE
jgi:hypothetical protein